ncbi:RHS repeat-associated core domain-containing protein|uniref:RHS repeat-associated core domain-containing protein n=1 Tax=Pseudomonas sp. SbOxS1 TaxID=2723884 RepID=UPI0015D104D4|nr:RHS repeat-associated core domain-containing protein [Pseudomonas sp. SbOxS1]NYU06621.1 RHS repeat-associated core domain-containing protein [Pseudomonas sp. SbOxS1]
MTNPKQPWLIRYSYDPLDRLTTHARSDTPERHRFYCKNRLATEIQGAIGHSIVQYSDFLLAQQQRQHDVHDTTLLATDLQRSVVNTLKKNTERQAIAYSPYGHRLAESGLTSLLGFNGERPDPVTGHYLLGNGYRAFNPVLMRFNCPDDLSPFGTGGVNSYAYCKGDPVNFIDPTGHLKKPIQYILDKINRTKLNKEIDTITSKIQADPLVTKLNHEHFKETTKQQSDLIYERHPVELKVDDPHSFQSMTLKKVPAHQRSEIHNGIAKRDTVRDIFLEEQKKHGVIGIDRVTEEMVKRFRPADGGALDFYNPSPFTYGLTTHMELFRIARTRRTIPTPIESIMKNAEQRKIRKS